MTSHLRHIVKSSEYGSAAAKRFFAYTDSMIAQGLEECDCPRARLQTNRTRRRRVSSSTGFEPPLYFPHHPTAVTETAKIAQNEDVMNEIVEVVDEKISIFLLLCLGGVTIRILERRDPDQLPFSAGISVVCEEDSRACRWLKIFSSHFPRHMGKFPSSLVIPFHLDNLDGALLLLLLLLLAHERRRFEQGRRKCRRRGENRRRMRK